MVTKELLIYVKKQIAKDKSLSQIRNKLYEVGWREADVDLAFKNIYSQDYVDNADTLEDVLKKSQQRYTPQKNNSLYYFVSLFVVFIIIIFCYIGYARKNYIINPQDAFYVATHNLSNSRSVSYNANIIITKTQNKLSEEDFDSVYSLTSALSDVKNSSHSYHLEMEGQIDLENKIASNNFRLINTKYLLTPSQLEGQFIFADDDVYYYSDGQSATGIYSDIETRNIWLKQENIARIRLDDKPTFGENKTDPNISVKRVGREFLDGMRVNRFMFSISSDDLTELIEKNHMFKLLIFNLLEEANSNWENWTIENGNVWIGENGYIYKLKFDMVSNSNENNLVFTRISTEIVLSDYNQPVLINLPMDFKQLDDIY